MAVCVGLFLFLDYCQTRNLKVAPIAIPVIVCGLAANVMVKMFTDKSLSETIIVALGRSPDLTDRTLFWPFLLAKGMEHPILGSGFASFWTPEIAAGVKEIIHIAPNQAHNGYLEVFLNLGGVGLLLLILALAGALKGAYRWMQTDFEQGRVRLILLSCVLLNNWTEASFSRPTQLVWFLFLLCALNPPLIPSPSSELVGSDGSFHPIGSETLVAPAGYSDGLVSEIAQMSS